MKWFFHPQGSDNDCLCKRFDLRSIANLRNFTSTLFIFIVLNSQIYAPTIFYMINLIIPSFSIRNFEHSYVDTPKKSIGIITLIIYACNNCYINCL